MPWALTPHQFTARGLSARSRELGSEVLTRDDALSTGDLLAILCEPTSEPQREFAGRAAEILVDRRLSTRQRQAAVRAAVGAGAVKPALDLMASSNDAGRAFEEDKREQLAALLTDPDHPASLSEFRSVLGAVDDGAVVAVAAAGRAWPAVATLVAHGAPASTAVRAGWAHEAARDGALSAAVAIADSLDGLALRGPAASKIAAARDHLDILANGIGAGAEGGGTIDVRPNVILYVTSQSLPHRSGGYATRTHGIATALIARGWDLKVLTRLGFPYIRWRSWDTRTAEPVDVVDGVEYRRALRGDERRYPDVPLAPYVHDFADFVESEARELGAAVIHAASFFHTGLAAGLAAKRLGLPFVYELRGLEDLYRSSRDPRFVHTEEYQYQRQMELQVCEMADRVLCITSALGDELIADGVDANKISVLGNGVEPSEFSPMEPDAELKAALGATGKTVVGYAGSTVDYEGLELLIEALEILDDPSIVLVVVGDGPHYQALLQRASISSVRDRITFVGRVPFADIPRYLSVFDIMPFPRLPLPVTEKVSPMKPFEAMATGKAIVVSNVAALAEIVEDGVTGVTFQKGDASALAQALRTLADDPDLRLALGQRAREAVVSTATWERRVEAADAIYRELGAAPAS